MLLINKRETVVTVKGVLLKPGTNKVSASWWSNAKKHKTVAKRLELGMLEVVNEGVDDIDLGIDGDEGAESADISGLNAREAISVIKETFDLKLLKAWAETESRATVTRAIDAQIEIMTAEPELRDRGQARQIQSGMSVEEIQVTVNPNSSDD